MTIALICIACLGLLNMGMGFFVSTTRARTGFMIGAPTEPGHPMSRAIRAHGNTSEYSAMLAVMIYVLGSLNPASWVLGSMIGATIARFSIVIGLLTGDLDRPTPFRFAGSLGTYLFGIALGVGLLLEALA